MSLQAACARHWSPDSDRRQVPLRRFARLNAFARTNVEAGFVRFFDGRRYLRGDAILVVGDERGSAGDPGHEENREPNTDAA